MTLEMAEVLPSTNNLPATSLTLETGFRVTLLVCRERVKSESFTTDGADASLVSLLMSSISPAADDFLPAGLTFDSNSSMASLVFPQLLLSVESFITKLLRQRLPAVRFPQVAA